MTSSKLYRAQMAELAGITPIQLDYFVKIGAVAPDLGDKRKHYSLFEASLVLIAAQLMPHMKDQRALAEVTGFIRDHVSIPGLPKTASAYTLYAHREEIRTDGPDGFPDEKFLNSSYAWLFLLEMGVHPRSPDVLSIMKKVCEIEGKDFDFELSDAKRRYVALMNERAGYRGITHDRVVVSGGYLDAIARDVPHYLQFAPNEDGSVQVVIDEETAPIPGRFSWVTVNLGALFKRLRPYVDADFYCSFDDYLEAHGVVPQAVGAA